MVAPVPEIMDTTSYAIDGKARTKETSKNA
jgi:hypothetical protein